MSPWGSYYVKELSHAMNFFDAVQIHFECKELPYWFLNCYSFKEKFMRISCGLCLLF